ncbi:unnamed protein product [Phaeothamnion confervicola]
MRNRGRSNRRIASLPISPAALLWKRGSCRARSSRALSHKYPCHVICIGYVIPNVAPFSLQRSRSAEGTLRRCHHRRGAPIRCRRRQHRSPFWIRWSTGRRRLPWGRLPSAKKERGGPQFGRARRITETGEGRL